MELVLLALLGVAGGLLTTVAGLGGGMVLVAVLSLSHDPRFAVAVTAPALLVANGHRAWMFRARLDRRVALSLAAGLVPGALAGGLLLPALPTWVLQALLVGATLLALGRARGCVRWTPRAGAMVPVGLGVGALAATSGGAAPLVGPVLWSSGLRGDVYVATVAVAAVSLHTGRVVGYALSGLLGLALAPSIAVLLAGLLSGNVAGKALHGKLPEWAEPKLELAALIVCSALAVAGLAR